MRDVGEVQPLLWNAADDFQEVHIQPPTLSIFSRSIHRK